MQPSDSRLDTNHAEGPRVERGLQGIGAVCQQVLRQRLGHGKGAADVAKVIARFGKSGITVVGLGAPLVHGKADKHEHQPEQREDALPSNLLLVAPQKRCEEDADGEGQQERVAQRVEHSAPVLREVEPDDVVAHVHGAEAREQQEGRVVGALRDDLHITLEAIHESPGQLAEWHPITAAKTRQCLQRHEEEADEKLEDAYPLCHVPDVQLSLPEG
mmetsp:Transcript_78927/g.218390  ORF Transcript_78927/g.218390 Transcript_78927/m.218390 type:complete len:216 (+) Transcript_78927:340-987(+)